MYTHAGWSKFVRTNSKDRSKIASQFFICFKQQNTLSPMLATMILVEEFLMSEFDDSVIDLKDFKILSTFEASCVFPNDNIRFTISSNKRSHHLTRDQITALKY